MASPTQTELDNWQTDITKVGAFANGAAADVTLRDGTTVIPNLAKLANTISTDATTAASTLRSDLIALYEPIVYASTAALTAALSGLDVGQAVIDDEAGEFGFVVDDSGNTFLPLTDALFDAQERAFHEAQAHRVSRMREDIEDASHDYVLPDQLYSPHRLEGSANATISTTADAGGNKINADGTFTIGAGSYNEYPVDVKNVIPGPDDYYYLYVVPVDPARAGDIEITFQQTDASAIVPEITLDRSVYGALKMTFRNRNPANGAVFSQIWPRINNTGDTSLAYYRPHLSAVEDAQIPRQMMRTFAEPAPIVQQDIRTFEFWTEPDFYNLNADQWLRNATVSIDSVNGDDGTGDGSRYNPFQTLGAIGAAGSMSDGAIVALRRGSVFEEQLDAYYGADAWDCAFVADDRGRVGDLPRISAWETIDDGDITGPDGDGNYSFTFQGRTSSAPALNAAMNNGYNRILVRERNTAMDAAGDAIAAGTVLRWVANTTDLNAAAGRALATYDSGSDTWTVTINPRTGVTPKDGSNTYEVTAQASAILHASGSTNNKNATFIGLHLDGAANGYGMASSGIGSKFDFCVLTGGDTHHSVCASFEIDRSLIASVGDVTDSITVAYTAGDNFIDTISPFRRCFIFARGNPYAHNGDGETKRAEAAIFESQYRVGKRDAITNAANGGIGIADQTNKIIRRRNYARNILDCVDRFATSFTPLVYDEDQFIDGVTRIQATRGGTRENIFITQNFGDRNPSAPANRGVPGVYASPGGVFENNLVVLTHEDGNFVPSGVSNYGADYGASLILSSILGNSIAATAQCKMRRNIFVVYLPFASSENRSLFLFEGTNAAIFGNTHADENIYVLLEAGSAPNFSGPAQDLAAPPTLIPAADTGGTANAITLTTGESLDANPGTICFTAGANNTDAVTVAIDGQDAVALKANGGAALSSGALVSDTRYTARLVGSEYQLCTFQTHSDISIYRKKTGMEANGLIIDARGHPLGLNAVFRDYANRDLRWANTDIADQILRFNRSRIKNGLPQVGPSWTINRQVKQLTVDDAYRIVSRRADLSA